MPYADSRCVSAGRIGRLPMARLLSPGSTAPYKTRRRPIRLLRTISQFGDGQLVGHPPARSLGPPSWKSACGPSPTHVGWRVRRRLTGRTTTGSPHADPPAASSFPPPPFSSPPRHCPRIDQATVGEHAPCDRSHQHRPNSRRCAPRPRTFASCPGSRRSDRSSVPPSRAVIVAELNEHVVWPLRQHRRPRPLGEKALGLRPRLRHGSPPRPPQTRRRTPAPSRSDRVDRPAGSGTKRPSSRRSTPLAAAAARLVRETRRLAATRQSAGNE